MPHLFFYPYKWNEIIYKHIYYTWDKPTIGLSKHTQIRITIMFNTQTTAQQNFKRSQDAVRKLMAQQHKARVDACVQAWVKNSPTKQTTPNQ